jgi:hypothetical protein
MADMAIEDAFDKYYEDLSTVLFDSLVFSEMAHATAANTDRTEPGYVPALGGASAEQRSFYRPPLAGPISNTLSHTCRLPPDRCVKAM